MLPKKKKLLIFYSSGSENIVTVISQQNLLLAFLPDPLESHQKSFHYLQSYFT